MNLIQALRKTADDIENNPEIHCWMFPNMCNCGLLAKSLGATGEEINRTVYFTFSEAVDDQKCELTGLPIGNVLRRLADAGMSPENIMDLEYLRDAMVIQRAGIVATARAYYARGPNVIRYLRAYADILSESEQRASAPSADLAIAPTHIVTQAVELARA